MMLKRHNRKALTFVLLLFAAVACGGSSRATQTVVPTVDPSQIAESVLVEVEKRFSEQLVTPLPTVDPEKIKSEVLAEIDRRLEELRVTPVPTVDASQVAEAVMQEVEPRLQSQNDAIDAVTSNLATAIAGENVEEALVSLYQRANPAVVFIIVPFVGSGSGFVFSAEGYIVTNNHVVADGDEYEVVFFNGERRRAVLVGSDADSDLAVIQVDKLPEDVEALPLAAPDSIQVGQFVVAIGNPFGEQGSMSLGIISALGRSLQSQREATSGGSYSLPRVIQTDAPINPGNSGGPLLNLDGEVIGVNSAIATRTGTNSGVGFSIPVDAIRQIVPSLISQGSYDYPYMGVTFDGEITLDDQEVYDLPQTEGAYVLEMSPGSPALKAGLIAADPRTGQGGDLIVKIDDQEIGSFDDLNAFLVFHTKFAQTIRITVLRAGELVELDLTLGARP